MINIITAQAPAPTSGAGSNIYAVVIEEAICQGFPVGTTPTATVVATASGAPVVAGGVTLQNYVFAVTVTYQPCGRSTKTEVATFAETATIAVPGSPGTLTPTVPTVPEITPAKVCGNRAHAVEIETSLTVAYTT